MGFISEVNVTKISHGSQASLDPSSPLAGRAKFMGRLFLDCAKLSFLSLAGITRLTFQLLSGKGFQNMALKPNPHSCWEKYKIRSSTESPSRE